MSGREKHAPADPAAEREQLRQLTRELHEAAQHAADERRALAAARAEIIGEIETLTEYLLGEQTTAVKAALDAQMAAVQGWITSAETQIREGFAAEMGAAGATDVVIRTCAMILHLSEPGLSVDEWVGNMKDVAAMHTVTGCSCLGCLAVKMARTGKLESPRDARRPYVRAAAAIASGATNAAAAATADGAGGILVATPEGLAAYKAAGGRVPDLIIDAR